MNPTRWLLGLLLLVGGCTSTTDATATTTTTTSTTAPTTTTRPIATTLNLGETSGDVDYCLEDNAGRLYVVAKELHIDDVPIRLPERIAWADAWALEGADGFRVACALAQLRNRPSTVTDRVWALYGDEAIAVIEKLEDTERVWCSEHSEDVLSASNTLGIGPGQQLPEQLGVPQTDVVDLGDRDFYGMWAAINPHDYVRACQAAFGAR